MTIFGFNSTCVSISPDFLAIQTQSSFFCFEPSGGDSGQGRKEDENEYDHWLVVAIRCALSWLLTGANHVLGFISVMTGVNLFAFAQLATGLVFLVRKFLAGITLGLFVFEHIVHAVRTSLEFFQG